MIKLLEALSNLEPVLPSGGWSIGKLATLGVILSSSDRCLKLDNDNLQKLFDCDFNSPSQFKDSSARKFIATRLKSGIAIKPEGVHDIFNILIDNDTLSKLEKSFDNLEELK